MIDNPAILITPLDEAVKPEDIQAISKALYEAQPGQVISSAFPVQVYHLLDGLWVESGDLSRLLVEKHDAECESVET